MGSRFGAVTFSSRVRGPRKRIDPTGGGGKSFVRPVLAGRSSHHHPKSCAFLEKELLASGCSSDFSSNVLDSIQFGYRLDSLQTQHRTNYFAEMVV